MDVQSGTRPISATSRRWHCLLLAAVLLLGLVVYVWQAFQFFMNGDEGTYAYAAWRVSEGEVPYRDFLTSEMPVFLYWGGLIVRLFGRSFVPLRVASMLTTLFAGYLLYAVNRELFGYPVAFLSLGLFLLQPDVFQSARFFRAEACLLLLELAGLYAFVLGEKRQRLGYTALGSALFGLAILNKLFGALPLAGCFVYLLCTALRERRPVPRVLRQGLALGIPALLLVGAAALIFTALTPYFFTAVYEHHAMLGAGTPLVERTRRALELYRDYVGQQWLAVLLAGLGVGIVLRRQRALASLFVWQVPTALVFMALSRESYVRHLVYLAPTLVTLMAVAILESLGTVRRLLAARSPLRAVSLVVALASILLLGLVALRPWIARNASYAARKEDDTPAFVALIQALTGPDDVVVADYPGLNFMAGRRSTYWAAEMSGVGARSGQIRGAQLIDEIERENAALVIINTSRIDPQMSMMVDYPSFRKYVQSHLALVDMVSWKWTWERAPRTFEVYSRSDTMPLKPDLDYGGDMALEAVQLDDAVLSSGSKLGLRWRWRALGPERDDYRVSVCLVDAAGHQWAEAHGGLVDPSTGLPTSHWSEQQVVLMSQKLALNPAMPAGNYYLVVQAYRGGSGFVAPASPSDGPTAGGLPVVAEVQVRAGQEVLAAAGTGRPTITHPLAGITFGEYYELLGYDFSATTVRPGEKLTVTLYWAYRQPSPVDHTVFIHLLDQGSQIQGQADRRPEGGGLLTSGWVMGDVLIDRFEVPVKAEASAGMLRVELGFYDLATGKRLPLVRDGQAAGEDSLIVPATIAVENPA